MSVPAPNAQARLFGEFSISDEAELGKKVHRLIRTRFDIIDDPEITDYIREIGQNLYKNAPPQPFPLQVEVINHNAVNAFATVAGYMAIFSGLILHMDSEDQLASIMAHELAHITQRHVARNIERSKVISVGSLLGLVAGALLGSDAGGAIAVGSIAGAQSAVLKYSREDEREADQVGLGYLIAAGYNPQAMTSAMQKMRRMQWFSGGEIPSYLSTHPGMDERVNYLSDRIERMDKNLLAREVDNSSFLRVQTLVRARYAEPSSALAYFREEKNQTCLTYLGQGIANARINRVSEARKNFEELISCDDSDPLFLREAGIFYFQFGDIDKSGRLLQKAIMLRPQESMALIYYGRILSEQGHFDTAASYLQRALRIVPEEPGAHEHLARIFGRSGNNFMAHIHMSYAHIYNNNKRQASFHREKARELAVDSEKKAVLISLEEAFRDQSQFWK